MVKIFSNREFYNQLAFDYDRMISFGKLVESRKKSLKNFVRPKMKSAIDLGCGSGVDSIALTSLGLKVTAFDPSRNMIKAAKENARKYGLKINFYNKSVDLIPVSFNQQHDLVISLGNTFANIEKKNFLFSLKKCFDLLKPEGVVLIQVLNYRKVLREKQRVVNINSSENNYFIRFYDFIRYGLIFNILFFNKENPSDFKFISTKLFPYTEDDFISGLKKAGFRKIVFFSDFNLSDYDKFNSKDLIIRAIKS